ncbi:hypothetical protein IE53DRAFT_390268 [Violaceomyces palustris]|uniref:Uncharacterized protein n=1 Tax=Violaceomyces palustris TaxID=1673888 RepID=A0ACD0NP63_9BASI|nr:hypothetical protein IE53DRAFT_390268 [Violaceomyces palustris]
MTTTSRTLPTLPTTASSPPPPTKNIWTKEDDNLTTASPSQLWRRELEGVERFWTFSHLHLGGAFDMVSLFQLEPRLFETKGTNRTERMERWRRSWTKLRSIQPILGCQLDPQTSEITTSSTFDSEWAHHSVHLEEFVGSSEEEDGRMDLCMETRRMDRFELTLFFHPQDQEVNWLAITNPHSLADAMAVFKLFKKLVEIHLEAIEEEEEEEVVFKVDPDRLPPSLSQALGFEPGQRGIQEIAKVARIQSTTGLDILPKPDQVDSNKEEEEDGPLPTKKWRRLSKLNPSQTSTLLTFCKSKGLTLASLVQACIFHSILEVKGGAGSEDETFTLPAMLFSRLQRKEPEDPIYSATTFCPTSVTIPSGSSLVQTALNVRESFRQALAFEVSCQETYIDGIIKLYSAVQAGHVPMPTTTIPTLSSLGDLDSDGGPFQGLKGYQIGSRNNQPSLGVHAWTLGREFHLSLSWCPGRFQEEQLEAFWDHLWRLIRLAASGEEGI